MATGISCTCCVSTVVPSCVPDGPMVDVALPGAVLKEKLKKEFSHKPGKQAFDLQLTIEDGSFSLVGLPGGLLRGDAVGNRRDLLRACVHHLHGRDNLLDGSHRNTAATVTHIGVVDVVGEHTNLLVIESPFSAVQIVAEIDAAPVTWSDKDRSTRLRMAGGSEDDARNLALQVGCCRNDGP